MRRGVKRGQGCVSCGRGGRRRRVATAVLVGALCVIKQSIQITITATVIPKSHGSRHTIARPCFSKGHNLPFQSMEAVNWTAME